MKNEAAIGYMILAAVELGFEQSLIDHLVANMRSAMDEYTEYEAEKAYQEN